jgi:hypothetical protein
MGVIKATIDMNGLRRWIKNQAKEVIRAVQVHHTQANHGMFYVQKREHNHVHITHKHMHVKKTCHLQ